MTKIQEWWLTLAKKQQLLMIVLILGGVLVAGALWLHQPSATRTLPATIPAAKGSGQMAATATDTRKQQSVRSTGVSQASSHDTRVFVDVQGAVKRPGLYQFTSEMRVADAIKEAGGLASRADRKQINLATRLTDQQQLYIPLKGEQAPAQSATSTGNSAMSGSGTSSPKSDKSVTVVNLNTATVTDLQQLTGVGEKKAQKIVDYRSEHGSFKSVADLAQVPGFGEKTVANLQDQLTT